MEEVKISTAGDSALLIEFGQEISPEINARITAFVHLLKAYRRCAGYDPGIYQSLDQL